MIILQICKTQASLSDFAAFAIFSGYDFTNLLKLTFPFSYTDLFGENVSVFTEILHNHFALNYSELSHFVCQQFAMVNRPRSLNSVAIM